MRLSYLAGILLLGLAAPARQTQDDKSYLRNMQTSLAPYGKADALNCRSVLITLYGPWGNFAIPDGYSESDPTQLTWTVVKVDVLRLYLNLADLDETKVLSQPMYSLEYLQSHQKGTAYVPDTPAIVLITTNSGSTMVVHSIDPDKLNTLRGQHHVTEDQMDFSMGERRLVIIPFLDQLHADVFLKTMQKAIVLCKSVSTGTR